LSMKVVATPSEVAFKSLMLLLAGDVAGVLAIFAACVLCAQSSAARQCSNESEFIFHCLDILRLLPALICIYIFVFFLVVVCLG